MFFRCKDANIFPLRQNCFGPFLNALNITSPCARPSASPHPTIPPFPPQLCTNFPPTQAEIPSAADHASPVSIQKLKYLKMSEKYFPRFQRRNALVFA